jgi:RNA polymerase sigma-70 factor (ECF subfamily)
MDPLTGAIGGSFGEAVGYASARPELRTEEVALVQALQAGSDEAFRQLIAQYSGPLYSLLLRSLADPADAGDVTQDVFIKVFRSIGGFHGDSSLRTWIYRIAMHEASNSRRWWVRHKKAEITIDSDVSDEDDDLCFSLRDTLADGRDSPFENARQSQLRSTVEAALREVPESFRTVVILREIEGMAYDEIAEIVGIHMGTVKSRLMRGRAALRALLCARLPEFAASTGKKTVRSASRPSAGASKEAR